MTRVLYFETFNPTPGNFVAGVSDITDPRDPAFSPNPTPSNFVKSQVESIIHSSVYTAVSSPTPSPTSTPAVVSAMQSIIPAWDLNESETYAVLVAFFLVLLVVLALALWWCLTPSPATEKNVSTGTLTTSDSEDKPLLEPSKIASNIPALKTLLAPPVGKTCLMYSSKGPKSVKMYLRGNQLVWITPSLLGGKTHQIDLASVLFVTANKKTKSLKNKAIVPDELCLSLITHDSSVDISVDTKSERDVLVLGFGELVQALKSHP